MTLFSTDSQRFKDLTANYDSRKFPLCAPHDGTKGLAFQRFANDFLIAIAAIDLKDPNETYDLSETLVGIDEGGSVAPPGQAAPIPMGTSQTAARRRTKRLKLAFAHLYQHITDLTLRKMLVDEAHNDGETAWQIVQRECDFPVTELELEDMKRNVRALTIIGTVGYHGHSISFFRRALTDENSKIPDQTDRIQEHELCLIMLHAIGAASPHLAVFTDEELKAGAGSRKHVYPQSHPTNAGERSLTAIVNHFEPMWKT